MVHCTEHNISFSLLCYNFFQFHRFTAQLFSIRIRFGVWANNKISVSNGNISSMMLIAICHLDVFFLLSIWIFWLGVHFSTNKGIICFIFDLLSAKSFSQFVTKVNVPSKHIEKSTIGLQVAHIHIDEAVRKLRSAWTLLFWINIISVREFYGKFLTKEIKYIEMNRSVQITKSREEMKNSFSKNCSLFHVFYVIFDWTK